MHAKPLLGVLRGWAGGLRLRAATGSGSKALARAVKGRTHLRHRALPDLLLPAQLLPQAPNLSVWECVGECMSGPMSADDQAAETEGGSAVLLLRSPWPESLPLLLSLLPHCITSRVRARTRA